MPATRTNLLIEQGATYSHGWAVTVDGEPIDDTWDARSQVRKEITSTTPLHVFDVVVTEEGYVVISISAEASSAFTWSDGIYDVEVVNNDESVTLRVAEGSISFKREVTR